MGVFGPKHDIIEVPSIPRDRAKLKAIIGTARHQKRRSNLMRLASYAMIAVALSLLMIRSLPTAARVPPHNGTYGLYFPVLIQGINSQNGGTNE
jgi:hypothetical protein